jgi:hypothetical protein
MPEMVLPGVYIEVRAEGLITPGRVTVGNIGIVGTASKGPVGSPPVLLGSASEARSTFGPYDPFSDGTKNELTLVRALELAYDNGASSVFAVRIESKSQKATAATFAIPAEGGGTSATLAAKTPGTWGNQLAVNVRKLASGEEGALVERETHGGAATVALARKPLTKVTRVQVKSATTGQTKEFPVKAVAQAGAVTANLAAGSIAFFAGEEPAALDKVIASYVVAPDASRLVTVRYKTDTVEHQEAFVVGDGTHLKELASASELVAVTAEGADAAKLPAPTQADGDPPVFKLFGVGTDTPGSNGEAVSEAEVKEALELLLNEPVHIVVAAGFGTGIADELKAHCEVASTDKMKADRIAVVGSDPKMSFDALRSHTVDSDRVILVAPGLKLSDPAPGAAGKEVTLPGAYMAAVVAGMLSANDPHISLTNKAVSVGALETRFTQAQIEQLVQRRVLVVEQQPGRGIRIVKGITTSTNSAFHQITTRRIVDFAKYGVRSAASPYIGKLNNERVRGALKSTITSFLQEMLDDEMLVKFEVDVFATRADEIKGIANVTILLQPTFSIDFIKVTMFLS